MVDLPFVTVDVFTDTKYFGNPLAIVHVDQGVALTGDQKQKIAKEFNLSETVFVHKLDSAENEVKIDIYTTTQELHFAGHPTIGAGTHILSSRPSKPSEQNQRKLTLITLAGKVPVTYSSSSGLTRLEVPHDITVHPTPISRVAIADAIGLGGDMESIISNVPFPNQQDGVVAVSIVKGMTFALVKLASLETLSKAKPTGIRLNPAIAGLHGGGESSVAFLGVYLYCVTGEEKDVNESIVLAKKITIQSRMIAGSLEDPATGSAASSLSSFLTLTSEVEGIHRFVITQGVEMGRKSDILGTFSDLCTLVTLGSYLTIPQLMWFQS